MKNLKNVSISVRVDEKTAEKLEILAEKKDRTVSNLIRIVLKNYLDLNAE